jgi:hypothetical protein
MAGATETIDGEVYEEFGGEIRKFRLTVPDLAKLQHPSECDAGPGVIAGELARAVQILELRREKKLSTLAAIGAGLGAWRVEFVTRPLFHGLVRGGMAPNDAGRLIRQNIEERGFLGLLENVTLAFQVVTGATHGPGDDPVGEPDGAAAARTPRRKPRSRAARSASRPSTATPAPSAGPPPTSPRRRSGSSTRPTKAGAGPTRARTKTTRTA